MRRVKEYRYQKLYFELLLTSKITIVSHLFPDVIAT